MTIEQKQRLLSFLQDGSGNYYYTGKIDGVWGEKSQAAEMRFLQEFGVDLNTKIELPVVEYEGSVLVFSKATDGVKQLTKNFKVREFACKDGSDPIFIHPSLPVWCQMVRDKFGYSFSPNSAYRTVNYNAGLKGASPKSKHCLGLAVDIPASGKTTPQMLYDFFEEILGNTGGLGLYSWGVHVDPRKTKSRWKG